MKNFLLFIALPCFATASILCPDSQTSCPNGQACCLRSDGRHSCCDAVGTEARLSENSPLAYLNSSNLLHGSSMDTGCSTETCTGTCCPERSTNQWCCQLQYAKCCDHGTCCNLGQKCCPDTCCPWMSLCCGENCCEVMGKCCSRYTGVCCSQDEQCCAESCCRKGYKCCGDWCCRGTLRCGTEPNTCINMGFALVPCLATLALLLSVSSLFNSRLL